MGCDAFISCFKVCLWCVCYCACCGLLVRCLELLCRVLSVVGVEVFLCFLDALLVSVVSFKFRWIIERLMPFVLVTYWPLLRVWGFVGFGVSWVAFHCVCLGYEFVVASCCDFLWGVCGLLALNVGGVVLQVVGVEYPCGVLICWRL